VICKFRIVAIETNHPTAGKINKYALQRRVGFIFWSTVDICDRFSQCLHVYEATKANRDKVIRVIKKLM